MNAVYSDVEVKRGLRAVCCRNQIPSLCRHREFQMKVQICKTVIAIRNGRRDRLTVCPNDLICIVLQAAADVVCTVVNSILAYCNLGVVFRKVNGLWKCVLETVCPCDPVRTVQNDLSCYAPFRND